MPPVSKIRRTMSSAWSKPCALEQGHHHAELLGGERMVGPICGSSTMRNVLPAGIENPASLGDRGGRPRDGVRRAMPLGVPVRGLQQFALAPLDQVSALAPAAAVEHRVVDRRVDDQVAVRRAARAVVVGLARRPSCAPPPSTSAVSSMTIVALPAPTP